jgi:proteasome accessory factor C
MAGRTTERLRRLLLAVPYVVRHPGTPVENLSRLFGVKEADLTEDLNLLLFTGLPPYSPGDLIDVEIEEGRVSIHMADMFSRPMRLTRAEALALYLRGTELLAETGLEEAAALRSALDKLQAGLGPETLGDLPAEAEEGGPAGPLAAVRRAVGDRERVEIEHYSAARDDVLTRRIDPEEVFRALGNWYVVAWCHLVDGERLFRVDRIRRVSPTGETFEPRGLLGQGRPLYTRSEKDIPVRLRLHPQARWVSEYFEVEEVRAEGEDLEVTLPTKDLTWVAKLVLRLGGAAEVLDPPEVRDQAQQAAEQALARYR